MDEKQMLLIPEVLRRLIVRAAAAMGESNG